ncbi:GNAT family N-acetyltransferase [Idiomarina xiamenensis]|uniref:GNAT family acetyltransferase n=1 Tax=Idiomarina xiamenensis 10-D-4 TaxID=740709 RepID=K2L4W1_9GAMM|nr:GNAT family N-acetyltransferase [Idiomarina xiamenensis]EKE84860.1 GNAT family acetyltransferase [Idiomarina xiamenensis 10-D-4]
MSEQATATRLSGELVYLTAEDLKLAASLLYQAYHDDELFLQLFQGHKADYEKRLRAAIREDLAAFWESGQPIVGIRDGDTLMGVACLTRPGASFGPGRYWHWRLKMLLTAGYLSTRQVIEKERLIQQAMPVEQFHMLAFIAVHPRYQQQGLSHLLVSAAATVLNEDSESQGVAVLVTQPHLMPLFQRHHYRSITQLSVQGVSGDLMFYARAAGSSW